MVLPRTPSDGSLAASASMFEAVTTTRKSQVIVDQIRALIRDEELSAGDRLPSERALSEQMGVSRVTVRDALRVLESAGLVDIRVGARGGAVVADPSVGYLGSALADIVSTANPSASEVTAARQVLEIGIMRLVVDRATGEDIDELRGMVERHRDAARAGKYVLEMSVEFHIRLAECTHNPALVMIVHGLHGPVLSSLREVEVVAPQMLEQGVEDHARLVDAIAAGDVATAEQIMSTHLDLTARHAAQAEKGRRRN